MASEISEESERGVNEHHEERGKSQSGEFISVLAGGYIGS